MIRFEGVISEFLKSKSFEIPKGAMAKIILRSNDEKMTLLKIMLGMKKPDEGRVYLFDRDMAELSEIRYYKLFKRIGVVRELGGMISNLKVWENLILSVWYHRRNNPAEFEGRVIEIFKQLDMDEAELKSLMGNLPGALPVHTKRLLGLVRVMLMEPELMIYDSILDGLSKDMTERLVKLTNTFHNSTEGRTSVYVTANEASLEGVATDMTIIFS